MKSSNNGGRFSFVLWLLLAALFLGPAAPAGPIGDPTDPPTVNAGEDQPIYENETVDLIGSATGNVPLYYEWYTGAGDTVYSDYILNYSYPGPDVYEAILHVTDVYGTWSEDTALITVLPLPTGSVCGTITDNAANPLAGVTVRVLDSENNTAAEPIVTGPDGAYLFEDLDIATYSVSIVTPLGFEASPGETQIDIAPANPCTQVGFILTPIMTANESRTMGFWKHQFDSYLSGHGTASIAEADLNVYLDTVYQHFDILGIYTELGTFDFEDAKDALAVRGDEPLVESAKQQLFAMLLNFAAGNIGNYSIVTEDSRKACEVVSYAAAAIKDGDTSNDQQAADVCAVVNRGGLAPGGIVPQSNTVYKTGDGSVPNGFRLKQNYPNPFNPSTGISFVLSHESQVKLQVFDMLGRSVATVYEGRLPAGIHTCFFDGSTVASGVYLYRLSVGDQVETRKMVLLK